MPQRILRDYTDSDAVNGLDAAAERFFVRLMMKADDYGLYTADKRLLRASLFPLLLNEVREADLDRWIAACEKASLVRLYEVAGKRYLEIVKFDQRLRAARAKHPFPPDFDDRVPADESNPPDNDSSTRTPSGSSPTLVSNSRADDRNPPPDSDTDSDNEEEDASASKRTRKNSSKNSFVAPTVEEVREYFKENGYTEESAKKAHKYYETGNWKDSKGTPVKNWKQKMQSVWFEEKNRAPAHSTAKDAAGATYAVMQPVPYGPPERWPIAEYERLKHQTEYKLLGYE